MPVCLGIDIGGSKVAAGLVDADGRVLRRAQAPTPATTGGAAIVRTATDLAGELIGDQRLAGIGIGAAGVIDRGRVIAATDLLTDWVGTDLIAGLADGLAVDPAVTPIVAVNDVHAHGAAEVWRGSGRGRDPVLLLAVGTGLGGVVVHQGVPAVGAHGAGGHLGHIANADAGAMPCSCGAVGHLEAIASGYGLVQLYHGLGGDASVAAAHQVTARIDSDSSAAEAVRQSATALGHAIGDLINTIDPEVVIISGSVGGAGPLWWDQVRSGVAESALPLLAGVEIVPAALGPDAGLIGAAKLGLDAAGARS